jgi:hypothetical protein
MSDQHDYGYCDICDRYHEDGCSWLKLAKKDSRERFRLLAKSLGLSEDFAND